MDALVGCCASRCETSTASASALNEAAGDRSALDLNPLLLPLSERREERLRGVPFNL